MKGGDMPHWHIPTQSKEELADVLGKIRSDLVAEIATDPTFEAVTGISMKEMSNHAIEAITAFFTIKERDPADPETWAQVYVLGFVVGTKYGESKQSDHMKGNTND
jgi:hypothetical protein